MGPAADSLHMCLHVQATQTPTRNYIGRAWNSAETSHMDTLLEPQLRVGMECAAMCTASIVHTPKTDRSCNAFGCEFGPTESDKIPSWLSCNAFVRHEI